METVVPSHIRSVIYDTGSEFKIAIPAQKDWVHILFVGIGLVAWAVGELSLLFVLFSRQNSEMGSLIIAISFIAWTAAGCVVFYVWLWNVVGREIITVGSQYLLIKRDVLGLGKINQYDISHIKHMRISVDTSRGSLDPNMQFWGMAGGMLAFDYDGRTCRFGAGLEKLEASAILKIVLKRGHWNVIDMDEKED